MRHLGQNSGDLWGIVMRAVNRMLRFIVYYVFSAISCIFLYGIGFLRGRNRALIYRIAAHFGPFDPNPNKPKPVIPKIAVSEVVPGRKNITILEPMAVDGNVTALELIVIIHLIKHNNPCMVFEIGTFDGRTTLNMAANCAEDAKVYTLDLPNEKRHGMKLPIEPCDALYINKELISLRYTGTEYSKKITQLYGDSARFDFSAFVNQIDFVFVDGSHSYEYALNDSLHALELLRDKRSVILWHDYDAWKGVTNALNKLYVDSPEFKGLKHIEGTSLVCLLRD